MIGQKLLLMEKLDANDNGWQILKFDDQKEYMAKQVKICCIRCCEYRRRQ